MGSGYGKLLPYLDAGPENTEDKLKKAYKRILTTLEVPVKSSIVWKQLILDPRNDHKTMNSLQEAVNFIHTGRVQKQNTLIITGQADQDQIVFATAYFMVLSGLPPNYADIAVSNAVKDLGWKFNKPYMNALKLFRQKPARQLREEMFKAGGEYSFSLLCEDVYRIYELAEIAKPTESQVKLDTPPSVKEDEGTFGPLVEVAVTPTSPKGNGQPVQGIPSGNSKEAVSVGLLNMVRSAPPPIPDVDNSAEHISADTLEDLMQIHSSVGEVIEPEPVNFVPEIKQVNETHKLVETPAPVAEPLSPSRTESVHSPTEDVKPESVTITNKVGAGPPSEVIPEPRKGVLQEAATPPTIANGLSKADQKGDVLLKISSLALEINSMENTSYVGDLDHQLGRKTEQSMGASVPSVAMNGAATPVMAETERNKRKVNIIRSPKSSEVDLAKRVDAYLESTTEEERKKNRKHVVIIRAKPQASVA